jgi:hypothetical protein
MMGACPMLEIPPFANPEAEADWAELSCLLGDKPIISRPEIEKTLEEGNFDSPDGIIEDIWQQVQWRQTVCSARYPIFASVGHLERLGPWDSYFPYTFMLLLSSQSFHKETEIKKEQWVKVSKIFERLVTKAIEQYVGCAINVGRPRGNNIPRSFGECLKFICSRTYERKVFGQLPFHHTQDGGVDVIGWKPFDNRCGQIMLLVQCCAGERWYDKLSEVDLKTWCNLIQFAANPIKSIAFPSVYSTLESVTWDNWLTYSWKGGILLDRLRIASLAAIDRTSDLGVQLVEWSEEQIRKLRWIE